MDRVQKETVASAAVDLAEALSRLALVRARLTSSGLTQPGNLAENAGRHVHTAITWACLAAEELKTILGPAALAMSTSSLDDYLYPTER